MAFAGHESMVSTTMHLTFLLLPFPYYLGLSDGQQNVEVVRASFHLLSFFPFSGL